MGTEGPLGEVHAHRRLRHAVRRVRGFLWRTESWGSMKSLSIALLCGVSMACGTEVTTTTQAARSPPSFVQRVWSRATRRVVVEVDYGPNATPYTGTVPGVGELWSVFRGNAARLFQGTGKTLVIPESVDAMQRIEVATREFTVAELMALSRRNLTTRASADMVVFHVLVLDGWFRDASGLRTDLLGGHLDNTGVIVVFRPVVARTAAMGASYIPKVVEQTTLVHEFGHAVGMVDNGVTARVATVDPMHRYHCTNPRCVMNAWYEGAPAAVAFVERYAMTRNAVLFGAECLADVDAMARATSL